MDAAKIRKEVRERYGSIARQGGSCCGPAAGCGEADPAMETGRRIGYSEEELKVVPEGSNLGLGCGNPTAVASLGRGETVLDLGSGAGFDCFLAARAAGPEGRVIGVDMTPEMIEKARENARKGGYGNVEFRLGEIENLPVADGSVDVVLSNCVINLSADKRRVFREAFRALRPGGRVMISDLVLAGPLPESVAAVPSAHVGCVAGAMSKEEYLDAIRAAGFRDVGIVEEASFPLDGFLSDPLTKEIAADLSLPPGTAGELEGKVASIRVRGVKPGEGVPGTGPGPGEVPKEARTAGLDHRTKELIAIGASVAANCQECLRYHVGKTKESGAGPKEIGEAIEIGRMVGKGAMASMRRFASTLQETSGAQDRPGTPDCGCGA